MVTETDEVAAALATARNRWPDDSDSPARLLLRLVQTGRQTLDEEAARAIEERRSTIRANAGSGTGLYEPDELDRMREDWPE